MSIAFILIIGTLPRSTKFFNIYTSNAGLPQEVRLSLYKDTLKIFAQYPFVGSGPDTFRDINRKYSSINTTNYDARYAHNEYLQQLSDTGLIGFMALMVLMAYFSGQIIKAYRIRKSEYFRAVGIGAALGCLSFLIHSMLDFNFKIPSNFILFTIIFSIAYSALDTKERDQDIKTGLNVLSIDTGSWKGLSFIVLFLLLIASLSAFSVLDHLSSFKRTVALEKKGVERLNDLSTALRLNPVNSANHLEMGRYFMDEGEFGRALPHLKNAESLNNTNSYLSYEIFKAERDLSNLKEAAVYLDRTITNDPMNGQWYKIAGDFYLDSDDLPKAVLNYKKAIMLDERFANSIFDRYLDKSTDVLIARSMISENNTALFFLLAEELIGRDLFPEAQSLIQGDMKLTPDSEESYGRLSEQLIKKRRFQMLRDLLQGAGEIKNSRLKTNLGVALCETGDLKRGVELLQQAFIENTLNVSSLDHIYSILIARDKDMLFNILERLAVKYRNKGHIHYLLSQYYDRIGEWYLALSEAKISVSMDIYNYNYRLNLGRIYSKKGLHIDAIDEFTKIIKLSPGFTWVKKYIADEYEKLGNEEEARRWRN